MKQAVLIAAFENIPHLIDFVEFLDDNFHFYIHLDHKSKINKSEIDQLKSKGNVILISRKYKVNWGGMNLTRAILFLAAEALKNPEFEYIHVVSGSDFPIKSSGEIINRLKSNLSKEFIEYFTLPHSSWSDGGLERMQYYYFNDLLNVRTFWGKKLADRLVSLQKACNLKRRIAPGFPVLYGGSSWWSLSSSCMSYVLDYIQNNRWFFNRFKYTFIPDEMFFQTIIMNSPFRNHVINNNLRMILWKTASAHPAVLDENDYNIIKKSDHLFARKFHFAESQKLIKLIREKYSQCQCIFLF